MKEQIIQLIAGWLARFFAGVANPQLEAEIKRHNENVAKHEQVVADAAIKRQESEAEYEKSNAQRLEWERLTREVDLQNSASKERYEAAQARIKARDAETERLNQDVLARTDSDAFSHRPV